MRPNRLREALRAGEPTLSTRIQSPWPSTVELVGHTGVFDYVEFLAEYAPYDLHDLDNWCRAAELYNLGAMIKIDQEPRRFLAQRAIGAGFGSVLFADVRSVEDALECVRAVRPETPEDGGNHGAAARRNAFVGHGGGPQYVQALRDVVVALMIEKKDAVEHLEEILAVPGIDMVQWGGTDYSMSVGRAGGRLTPEMRAVERRVFETALRMGIPPRAEIGNVDDAKYFLDMGVRHFSLGTDMTILFSWWRQNGEKMRQALSGG